MERFLYLCDGLIVKWERLHFDSVSRGMKRKEGNDEGDGNKKARGESTEYKPLLIASVVEHCKSCGIPCHQRETYTPPPTSLLPVLRMDELMDS